MKGHRTKDALQGPSGQVSLLFVEDESIIVSAFEGLLKRRFKEVFTASNGEEGLKLFATHQPDMVITDILMPGMDGLEMIRRIRALRPDTPIIVMTALNEETYLEKAKALDIQGYLLKPINEKEFYSILHATAAAICERMSQEPRD